MWRLQLTSTCCTSNLEGIAVPACGTMCRTWLERVHSAVRPYEIHTAISFLRRLPAPWRLESLELGVLAAAHEWPIADYREWRINFRAWYQDARNKAHAVQGSSLDASRSYEKLPPELRGIITKYLDAGDKSSLARTCTRLEALVEMTPLEYFTVLVDELTLDRANHDIFMHTSGRQVCKKDCSTLFGLTATDMKGVTYNLVRQREIWGRNSGCICLYGTDTIAKLLCTKHKGDVDSFHERMHKRAERSEAAKARARAKSN